MLPALNPPGGGTASEGTEWDNGESRIVKDNHGSGELFALRYSESTGSYVYMIASADNGKTWRMVSNTAASTSGCVGSCSLFPSTAYKILGMTQDSAGKTHVLMGGNDYSGGSTFREYYLRLKLNYDANSKLTGYNLEAVLALPDHKRSMNVLSDLRGDIRVIDFNGAEALMYIVNVTTVSSQDTRDIKSFVGHTANTSPGATSSFMDLSGATGDTKVIDSCSFTMPNGSSYCTASPAYFSTHNMTATFAQNKSTKDVYVFLGAIEADYAIFNGAGAQPEESHLRYYRLSWNGSGWIAGPSVQIAQDNGSYMPLLFSAQSGANYVWLMYLHPDNGIVFGRINSSGTYQQVTNPLSVKNNNGWGVFSVSPDDSKIWTIWNLTTNIDAGAGDHASTAQAYWDGTSWNISSDMGVTTGNNSGLVGTCGWSNGVAAILFRGVLLRPSPPVPMAAAIWGT